MPPVCPSGLAGDILDPSRPLVTYKGPRDPLSRAKVRREVQTHLDDPRALGEIFEALGLLPIITLQKRRTSFRLGRCMIELDELPVGGRFVEIEGPSLRQVEAIKKKLAIDGEPIKSNYIDLVCDRCHWAGKDCLVVTFARCSRGCPKK